MGSAMPSDHVVITVHGIRTFGQWQQRLSRLLRRTEPDIEVHNYTYGYFSILAFLIPPFRWIVTLRFRRQLEQIICNRSISRVDIVGHSFGTHIIAWALKRKSPNILPNIHTVLLSGSVLKPSFDWSLLFKHSVVQRVVNDCGINDNVLIINQLFVLFSGMAGRLGFQGMTGQRLFNRYFLGGHSHYFEDNGQPSDVFMEKYWVPVICSNDSIESVDQRAVPSFFQGLTTTVLQNSEVIKISTYSLLIVIPSFVYHGLYKEAVLAKEIAIREEIKAIEAAEKAVKERDFTLETLVWVFNQSSTMEFDRSGIDGELNKKLIEGTLERFKKMKYEGNMLFEVHIGDFKFFSDITENGMHAGALATNEIKNAYPNLEYSKYTLSYAIGIGDRAGKSIGDIAQMAGIDSSKISSKNYGYEKPNYPYPANGNDLDEWNRIAKLNHRVILILEGK